MRAVALLLLAAACGDTNQAASNCLDVMCPVGTAPRLESELSEAIDLDVAFDPVTYAGEVAFKRVGEGSCEILCATIEPCDEGTFPVITEDCFTCGFVDSVSGGVDQGSCDG